MAAWQDEILRDRERDRRRYLGWGIFWGVLMSHLVFGLILSATGVCK